MKMLADMRRLRGFRYRCDIIAYVVWIYYRLVLRTADVEDMLAERGEAPRSQSALFDAAISRQSTLLQILSQILLQPQ